MMSKHLEILSMLGKKWNGSLQFAKMLRNIRM